MPAAKEIISDSAKAKILSLLSAKILYYSMPLDKKNRNWPKMTTEISKKSFLVVRIVYF